MSHKKIPTLHKEHAAAHFEIYAVTIQNGKIFKYHAQKLIINILKRFRYQIFLAFKETVYVL